MNAINKKFWKNKKVLITGYKGFKGRWMVRFLKTLGAHIRGVDKSHQCNLNLLGSDGITGDIRNAKWLAGFVKDFDPDIIIHMAAQAIVARAHTNPLETFETNIQGTANVLNAAKYLQIIRPRVILNITTDKVYKNSINSSENDALGGNGIYDYSKSCADGIAEKMTEVFEGNIAIGNVRAGNVIGPDDTAPFRLMPDIINAVEKKEPLIIRRPNAIRPWQHVFDCIASYLKSIESLYKRCSPDKKIFDKWNITSEGCSVSVGMFVALSAGILAEHGYRLLTKFENSGLPETEILTINTAKFKREIGLFPVYNSIDLILRATIIRYLAPWEDGGYEAVETYLKRSAKING